MLEEERLQATCIRVGCVCMGGWRGVFFMCVGGARAYGGERGSPAAVMQILRPGLRTADASCTALRMQASYAMGYNLAIEYLADYENNWMLDSFRTFNQRVLIPQGRKLTKWAFLEVRGVAHELQFFASSCSDDIARVHPIAWLACISHRQMHHHAAGSTRALEPLAERQITNQNISSCPHVYPLPKSDCPGCRCTR
jgi:hypothetical protein